MCFKLKNYYEYINPKKAVKYDNPKYDTVNMKHPFRMIGIGASGAGKTNILLNIIESFNGTFEVIKIVCKMPDEKLYELLSEKIPPEQLIFYKTLADLPNPDELGHNEYQQLLIFDDQVAEKDEKIVEEYYLRGRKIGKGISMVYLSQSYFNILSIVRKNINHIIFSRISGKRDLNLILSEFAVGVEKDDLFKMYKFAIKHGFLKINIESNNINEKFSINFTDFFIVENDDKI